MTKSDSFKRVLSALISRSKSSVFMGNPFVMLRSFEGVCFACTGRVSRNTPVKMILEGISRPNLEHCYAN
jgi:hypothetical protein